MGGGKYFWIFIGFCIIFRCAAPSNTLPHFNCYKYYRGAAALTLYACTILFEEKNGAAHRNICSTWKIMPSVNLLKKTIRKKIFL